MSPRQLKRQYGLSQFKGPYWFKNNNSKILAVAHLDSVQPWTHCHFIDDRVYCPTLDDRLGAWVILEGLSDLSYDILLTTNEEMCNSTAQFFKTDKEYNWIFQFDRSGRDVVMYDYETPELRKKLVDVGFKVGFGSYTDICEIEHLNCKGFNFGTGYYDYHSNYAYAKIPELLESMYRFRAFYAKYSEIKFPHTSTEHLYHGNFSNLNNILLSKHSDTVICDSCESEVDIDDAVNVLGPYHLCPECYDVYLHQED